MKIYCKPLSANTLECVFMLHSLTRYLSRIFMGFVNLCSIPFNMCWLSGCHISEALTFGPLDKASQRKDPRWLTTELLICDFGCPR